MKLFPFPEPQVHLTLRPTSKGRASIYWDHETRIVRWMGRNALRRIHAVGTFPDIELDDLTAWLSDHCTRALDYVHEARFAKMVQDAAVFALTAFDPKEHAIRVERARNGGRKAAHGRRRPRYSPADLEEGLSIAEQAVKLGCSEATISRLRARRKVEAEQQREAAFEAELDTLAIPAPEAPDSPEPTTFDLDAALAEMDAEQATQPREEADYDRLMDSAQWLDMDSIEDAFADIVAGMIAPPEPPTEHDAARLARAEAWMVQNPSYLLEGVVL